MGWVQTVGNELFRTVCTRSGKADWLFFNSIAQMTGTPKWRRPWANGFGARFDQAGRSAKIEPERILGHSEGMTFFSEAPGLLEFTIRCCGNLSAGQMRRAFHASRLRAGLEELNDKRTGFAATMLQNIMSPRFLHFRKLRRSAETLVIPLVSWI